MRQTRFRLITRSTLAVVVCLLAVSVQGEPLQEKSTSIMYFDVLELPARIDEPKLIKRANNYSLKCAIANRSDEPLLGVRLILLIVDRDGKLRTHLTWSEETQVAASSISSFEFSAPIKEKIQSADNLFLALDEVIGRETIWRPVDAQKALRAYSRGQHDVIPTVRTVANKDDREPVRVIPKLERKQ